MSNEVRATTALLRGEADDSESGLDFYDDDDLRAETETHIVLLRSAADLLDDLVAERDKIREAASWLLANRGHRGEQQAWKLLQDALGDSQ